MVKNILLFFSLTLGIAIGLYVPCSIRAAEQVVNFNNDQCPVMAGPAISDYAVVHNGIRYNFCCTGCQKSFKKDPEKYLAKLTNNGAMLDLHNELCPITGRAATAENTAIYNGMKVQFCSPMCLDTFRKDKAAAIKKLGINPETGKKL